MQEGATFEPEHLVRRADVDEVGTCRGHPAQGLGVGGVAAGVGQDPPELGRRACHRRLPRGLGHRHRLRPEGVREERDPGGRDRDVRSEQSVERLGTDVGGRPGHGGVCRVARRTLRCRPVVAEQLQGAARGCGVGEQDVRAGVHESLRRPVEPLRVGGRAGDRDDDGQLTAARGGGLAGSTDGGSELGSGIRVRAVAEHEVEEEHAARRVGGLDGDAVEAQ